MREACKFNVQIHNGNILKSVVTKDPGVSSILLFSGSGINFPRPLYIHTDTHICTHIHLHTHIHTYILMYIYIYVYVYVNAHIYAHIHTYIHTHMYVIRK